MLDKEEQYENRESMGNSWFGNMFPKKELVTVRLFGNVYLEQVEEMRIKIKHNM